ncbi:YczE/YyaS/YitT family protein [Propionibacteriaceae bacterium Y2011]
MDDTPEPEPARTLLGLQTMTPRQQLRAGRLPRRLTQLFVGLTVFGLSMAMLIRGGLGMIPWDVFHYGVASHVPLTFGTVAIITALVVLLLWIPLREVPGLGTIANAVWVGVAVDVFLALLSAPDGLLARIGLMVGGIVLNAVATALYIGAQFGPGPRDGLMTGLARRLPVSMRVIRTAIEVVVVLVGWLLGGVVGIGTVLFALSIGPLTQLFLPPLVVRVDPPSSPTPRQARET